MDQDNDQVWMDWVAFIEEEEQQQQLEEEELQQQGEGDGEIEEEEEGFVLNQLFELDENADQVDDEQIHANDAGVLNLADEEEQPVVGDDQVWMDWVAFMEEEEAEELQQQGGEGDGEIEVEEGFFLDQLFDQFDPGEDELPVGDFPDGDGEVLGAGGEVEVQGGGLQQLAGGEDFPDGGGDVLGAGGEIEVQGEGGGLQQHAGGVDDAGEEFP